MVEGQCCVQHAVYQDISIFRNENVMLGQFFYLGNSVLAGIYKQKLDATHSASGTTAADFVDEIRDLLAAVAAAELLLLLPYYPIPSLLVLLLEVLVLLNRCAKCAAREYHFNARMKKQDHLPAFQPPKLFVVLELTQPSPDTSFCIFSDCARVDENDIR